VGKIHEMYQFTLRMKPGGLGDDAVEFLADETRVSSAAERFTAPLSAGKTATAGKATHVEPPPKLREALGRANVAKDVPHEGLSSTLERLTSLKNTMVDKLEKVRIKPLAKNAPKADAERMLKWADALDDLGTKISELEAHLVSVAVDPHRLDGIVKAVTAFNNRAARWPDKVTDSDPCFAR
jgi:hypothetical protein